MAGKKIVEIPGQMTVWDFCTDSSKYVVQANKLIGGKQALKLNSAKLIRAAIMQIKKTDTELKPYIVTIQEFADMLGISATNVYREAEELTDDILQNPVYIREEVKGKVTRFIKIPWVRYCEYSRNAGIAIQLNDKLKPFLIGLRERYTQYTLDSVLSMRSVYAIRIFEILQSKILERTIPLEGIHVKVSVDEIRECCDCVDKYTQFSGFRQKVLEKAKEEINRTTPYYIDYAFMRTGRNITDVLFLVNMNYHNSETFRIPEVRERKK